MPLIEHLKEFLIEQFKEMSNNVEIGENVQSLRSIVNEIFKTLGRGYDKEVYENALKIELELKQISFENRKRIPVKYKEQECGTLIIDFYLPAQKMLLTLYADAQEPSLKYLQQAKNQMSAMNAMSPTMIHGCAVINFGSPYVNQRNEADFVVITHV